jgi:beta-lactamase class A
MKLPLAIAYFKLAEVDPSILAAPIMYERKEPVNSDTQNIKPSNPLVIGTSYTVHELIEHMLVNSDNDASSLLVSHIDTKIFENTLIELGIKIPGNSQNYDFLNAKSYGAIFRNLYNASYLNRESSQEILSLLVTSSFKGIDQLLPASTKVAHKFGESEFVTEEGTVAHELHDCGIVYKDQHPYTICVMTEGDSYQELTEVIKTISLLAYSHL